MPTPNRSKVVGSGMGFATILAVDGMKPQQSTDRKPTPIEVKR